MSRQDRRRQRRESGIPPVGNATAAAPATPPTQPSEGGWWRDPWLWVVAGGAVALVLFSAYKFLPLSDPGEQPKFVTFIDDVEKGSPHNLGEQKADAKSPAKDAPDDFLSEFTKEDGDTGKENADGTFANKDLERQLQALVEINTQLVALKKRSKAAGVASEEELQQARALTDQFDRTSAALEKDLAGARRVRPRDPVPRWVTGELLMIIGGEPEEIQPHLEFAAANGLRRPRLAASLALTQLEANRFAESYRTADAALDQFATDHYLWSAFTQTALANNQFEAVLDRLARAFPTGLPVWAKAHRHEAEVLQAKWEAEQKIRRAEARADDLPRVRLVVEHRRFARDPDGNPLTTIESTGRGEIVLELFENEAPLTVANFIDLVGQKFYDGTSFHLAVPRTTVLGGDPNTKNDDPDDDGAGGPGYVIAEEYRAKNARNHFRGSIGMVKTEPRTAGSQFFFCLEPAPAMDGNFTVFGRILEGQDVADKITRGRTTRKVGSFGRIIPGDLLVRAEILRKRPHEYGAVKERP